jgi:hypothetical protein
MHTVTNLVCVTSLHELCGGVHGLLQLEAPGGASIGLG